MNDKYFDEFQDSVLNDENRALEHSKNDTDIIYIDSEKTVCGEDRAYLNDTVEENVNFNDLSKLEMLKFNLQEETYPYFTDKQLRLLLSQYGSVRRASYEGCLIKSRDDSVSLGPINTVSNEKYWLRMAKRFSSYKDDYSTNGSRNKRRKSMRRADEI